MSAIYPPDRLPGVDLRPLSDPQMAALRREAVRRSLSFNELLAVLVLDASERLIHRGDPHHETPTTRDIIRGASEAWVSIPVETVAAEGVN